MPRLLCFFRLTLHWEAGERNSEQCRQTRSVVPETNSRPEDEGYQDAPPRDCCVTPRGPVADEVQSCWLDRIPLTLAQRGLCAHEPTHPWGQVPSAILSPADKVLQPRTSSTSKTQILAGTNQT